MLGPIYALIVKYRCHTAPPLNRGILWNNRREIFYPEIHMCGSMVCWFTGLKKGHLTLMWGEKRVLSYQVLPQ